MGAYGIEARNMNTRPNSQMPAASGMPNSFSTCTSTSYLARLKSAVRLPGRAITPGVDPKATRATHLWKQAKLANEAGLNPQLLHTACADDKAHLTVAKYAA